MKMMLNQLWKQVMNHWMKDLKMIKGGEIGFESQSEDGDGVEATVVDQQVVGSSQACVEEVLSQFNDLFESGEAFEHDIEHGNDENDSSDDENDRQFEVVARFGPCSQDTFNLGDPESDKEDEDWDPVDVHSSQTSEGSLVSDNEEEDTEMNNFVISTRNCYVEEDTERTDDPEATVSKKNLKLKINMEWRHIGECRQSIKDMAVSNRFSFKHKKNDKERAHLTFAPVDLFNKIYHEYGVHISYWTAWRARIMLLEKMHDEFVGFFVAYNASLDGFVKGYRPIIGLDGCFLKGKDENKFTWNKMLSLLKPHLNKHPAGHLTFISDRQKGLINGVATNIPCDITGDGLSEGDLVPAIQGVIEKLEAKYHRYKISGVAPNEFLATNTKNGKTFLVHITDMTCECIVWQMTGIPCVHAIVVIKPRRPKNESWAKYCSHYYTVESFRATYAGYIYLIANKEHWDKIVI
ncbi:hypothetical protein IFM89_011667 [Coptis chinensis]|uniref:SWIM-type domain-containing protein n=1 Tax=Coptis chinensis TaxID=261450 RepID=A0A835LVN8_9MAGN|nr:hypothetical protein IFM89_011667 [Coptis chinensis]